MSVREPNSLKCTNTQEGSVIALLDNPLGPSTPSRTICMHYLNLPLQQRSWVGSRSHTCPHNPGQCNRNWTLQAHPGHNRAPSNNVMHLMHELRRGVCLRLRAGVMRSRWRSAVTPARSGEGGCQRGFKAHGGEGQLAEG